MHITCQRFSNFCFAYHFAVLRISRAPLMIKNRTIQIFNSFVSLWLGDKILKRICYLFIKKSDKIQNLCKKNFCEKNEVASLKLPRRYQILNCTRFQARILTNTEFISKLGFYCEQCREYNFTKISPQFENCFNFNIIYF